MEFVCEAPGKIIISGEHSVVYNHNAVCGAIDLKCKCECRIVDSPNINPTIVFTLHDLGQ